MSKNLPTPVEDAADIAKFASGVFAVAISALYPEMAVVAGMSQAAVSVAADRYLKKPQAVLAAELKAGNLSALTDEQKAAFVPMAFRFFEAARQGEYEHNLDVLAAYITGELKKEIPDPGSVGRMARRIEGLSVVDLKVLSCIEAIISEYEIDISIIYHHNAFTSSILYNTQGKEIGLTTNELLNSLSELANRNILYQNSINGYIQTDEHFITTPAFRDLISSVKSKIDGSAQQERP